MHLRVVGGERGWASGEVGGYSPPAPSQSPGAPHGHPEPPVSAASHAAGAPATAQPLCPPPAPLFVVLIDRRLSPGCQGCSHAPARAHGRTRVRRQAARGLPLYIMQPPNAFGIHRCRGAGGGGAPAVFPKVPWLRLSLWHEVGQRLQVKILQVGKILVLPVYTLDRSHRWEKV